MKKLLLGFMVCICLFGCIGFIGCDNNSTPEGSDNSQEEVLPDNKPETPVDPVLPDNPEPDDSKEDSSDNQTPAPEPEVVFEESEKLEIVELIKSMIFPLFYISIEEVEVKYNSGELSFELRLGFEEDTIDMQEGSFALDEVLDEELSSYENLKKKVTYEGNEIIVNIEKLG